MPTKQTTSPIISISKTRRRVIKPRKMYMGGGTLRLLDSTTLDAFLLELHPEEARQVDDLWKSKTKDENGGAKREFILDNLALRYSYVDGRGRSVPVSSASMAALVVRFGMGVRDEMRANAKKLADGKIDLQEWYNEQARLMKLSYRASISSARGQKPEQGLSDEEKAVLLFLLYLLFRRLNQTAHDILSGKVALDGRFVNRMGMYGMAVKSIWENWRLWMAKKTGYTEARRVLGVAEHCHDEYDVLDRKISDGCVELADKGWIPIEQMVPIGQATCLSNCKCRIIYRARKPGILLLEKIAEVLKPPQLVNFNKSEFREVRDRRGRLLFKYDPQSHRVEIKHKGMDSAQVVDLREYQ